MQDSTQEAIGEMAVQAHVSAPPRPSVPHHLGTRAPISIEFSMESTANLKLLAKTAGRPHPQIEEASLLATLALADCELGQGLSAHPHRALGLTQAGPMKALAH